HANFVEAANVADHEVLTEVAVAAGLSRSRVEQVLSGDDYTSEVWADVEQAQRYGATGVPFFVIDEKYAVPGAQPAETFGQVLDRAWSESQPQLTVVGAGEAEAEVCGPDGCAT